MFQDFRVFIKKQTNPLTSCVYLKHIIFHEPAVAEQIPPSSMCPHATTQINQLQDINHLSDHSLTRMRLKKDALVVDGFHLSV